jgi:hypothetical protein
MKYKTIEEVHVACKNGDGDESKLEIIVDNDYTGFYLSSDVDGEDDDIICRGNGEYDVTELYRLLFPTTICKGNGDYDVIELYGLLFPKAMVDRC